MSDIKKRFYLSVKMINSLRDGANNDELLKLYALFKQSNFGNCNLNNPSSFNIKESAKWSAWNNLKGMSQSDAMNKYSDFVLVLLDEYGTK